MANNNNIKGISVEIGADSSKLAEALKNTTKDCGKLQNELAKVNKALKFDPESAVLAAQKQEILKEAAQKTAEKLELLKQKQESMNKALNSGKISGQEYREFQREIESTRSKLTYYNSELQKSAQAEKELAAGTGKAKEDIQKLSTETVKAQKSLNNFAESSTKAKTEVRQIGEAVNYSASKFETLDSKLNTIFKGTLAGFTGKKLVDYFIGSNADFEQYTTAFTTTLGSAEKAKDLMNDIADFAAETPLSLESLAGTAQILQAYGVAEDEIINKMQTAGDLAQGQADKMDTIAKAYGKMFATQKADWENLKIILEAGVPILQTLADQYGVTTAEMQSMISKGTVGMADLDKALQSLTTGNGQFAGAMKAQSETMSGMLSTLNDSFVKFGRDAGERAFEQIKDSLRRLMNAIDEASKNGTLEQIAEDIGNALNILIKILMSAVEFIVKFKAEIFAGVTAMEAFKLSLKITDLIGKLKTAFAALTSSTNTATAAQWANNAALSANPIGLVVGAIAALIAGTVTLTAASIDSTDALRDIKEEYEAIKERSEETAKSFRSEVDTIKAKNDIYEAALEEYEKTGKGLETLQYAAEELQNVLPDGISLIDKESGAYRLLGDELDNVIEKMQKRVDLSIQEDTYKAAIEAQNKAYDDYEKKRAEFQKEADLISSGVIDKSASSSYESLKKAAQEAYAEYEKYEKEADNKLAEYKQMLLSNNEEEAQAVNNNLEETAETFAEAQKKLKSSYDLTEKTESEYYTGLEELLKKHNVEMTDETEKYYIDIAQYKKKQEEKALSEQKAAAEKMAAEQKQLNEKSKQEAEKAAKEAADSWEKEFEAVSNEAIKAFDKISDKRERLEDKLADSVTVSVEEDDEYKLTDLEAETEKLKEYQRLREELLASTNEEFVTETFDSMSVDEAGKYASTLLSNRDGLQQYLADWQEQQAVISEISMNTYKNEADNVKDYFFNEIGEKLNEMPDIAAIAGAETAKKYADSACEALRQKMAEINASMMDIYYNPKLNPNFRYNGTSDYEYGRVTSQTPKVIKETVHMPVGDIVIQVDGQNLVTRTLNELRDQVLIHGRYSDLF